MLDRSEAEEWAATEFLDAPEDDGDFPQRLQKTARMGEKYELEVGDHGHFILPEKFRNAGDHTTQVSLIRTLIVAEYRKFSVLLTVSPVSDVLHRSQAEPSFCSDSMG